MNQTTLADLHEMLGLCYFYKEQGVLKVTLDTDEAVEIIERLISFEQALFVSKLSIKENK